MSASTANVFYVLARAQSEGASAIFFNHTIGGNGNHYIVAHNFGSAEYNGNVIVYFLKRESANPL